LNGDFAFSGVAFSKRTAQGKWMSDPLSFLIRRVDFGVDVAVVRQLFLENSDLAASSSVKGIELVNALRRLFIVRALSQRPSLHGEGDPGLPRFSPASWRSVVAD
jgi:hypothetical protein